MKFHFQHLGTIKKTTLDLRPLTIIVGPNNTNKTYLAYCVHGLIQSLAHGSELDWRIGSEKRQITIKLADLTFAVQDVASELARTFTNHLGEFFQDTYGGVFSSTILQVQVQEKDVASVLQTLGVTVKGQTCTIETGEILGRAAIVRSFASAIVEQLSRPPLTLPAERNAFIITYKMLSARRYRVLRDRERSLLRPKGQRMSEAAIEAREREMAVLREQGDIRYPRPIEEFLDFLTDVELNAARRRNDGKSALGKLSRAIETHIQGGHRIGYERTMLGGSELALTVSNQLRVDLYNASSSIKQIAPLLLYLRYRAAPGQTLIIDEPEMNLHPEGQAKLLEALAMLANLGVHVLLTTHSPYFMAHLNNLIAADMKSPARKKRQANHLYMGDPAAFLSPADVSAYEMRPEGLVSLADPEYGIRWDTLSDVSAELQRRYFAIVEEPVARTKAK